MVGEAEDAAGRDGWHFSQPNNSLDKDLSTDRLDWHLLGPTSPCKSPHWYLNIRALFSGAFDYASQIP